MSSLYKTITELVRMAVRFLRLGDESRSEKAREGLRSITESVGIGWEQKQYPIEELLKDDLTSKIPQMNGSLVDARHVLRYCVDFASMEDEGVDEIWLELWRLTRHSHNMVAWVGQLFTIQVKWGQSSIRLNLVVMVDGVMEHGDVPVVLECGPGDLKAYTVSKFNWEIFLAFSNQDNVTVSAAQRMLYLAIMDSEAYDFVDPDTFCCWPYHLVEEEMGRHPPGVFFKRFSAERAGLISVEEAWEEDEVASSDRDEEGRSSSSRREDFGQSPILNFLTTMEMVREYKEADKLDGHKMEVKGDEYDETDGVTLFESPELLRGPICEKPKPRSKRAKRKGISKEKRTKTVLTSEQFKAILALCIGGVDPSRSEEEIEEEVNKVDIEKLAKQMNQDLIGLADEEDVGEILRTAVKECKEGEEEEEALNLSGWSNTKVRPSSEDELEEEEFPVLGDESDVLLNDSMMSREVNDELFNEDVDLEDMPPLESSEDWGKPGDWDSTASSWVSGEYSSDNKSSKGNSPKGYSPQSQESGSPPTKKVKRRTRWDKPGEASGLVPMTPSPASKYFQADFTPFLAKKLSDEEIVVVSTDSSDKEKARKRRVSKHINFAEINTVRQGHPGVALHMEASEEAEDGELMDKLLDEEEVRDDTSEEITEVVTMS